LHHIFFVCDNWLWFAVFISAGSHAGDSGGAQCSSEQAQETKDSRAESRVSTGPEGNFLRVGEGKSDGVSEALYSFVFLAIGQLRLNLDPFRLLALPFGITFHHQLVLLSHHPIFLLPYHFLKLVSFLGANRTKSASVCPQLLRGAI